MGNLFDLIFENFWVVLILFGIVSSMLGGDKKQQKRKPYSETTQMPTMTPAKRAEHKQVPRQQHRAKKVQEVAAKAQSYEQVKEELSTAQAYLAEKAAMIQKQKQAEQMPRKPQGLKTPVADSKVTQGTFSQNEVVNGIIMAEILGAPRAKKPYSGLRR